MCSYNKCARITIREAQQYKSIVQAKIVFCGITITSLRSESRYTVSIYLERCSQSFKTWLSTLYGMLRGGGGGGAVTTRCACPDPKTQWGLVARNSRLRLRSPSEPPENLKKQRRVNSCRRQLPSIFSGPVKTRTRLIFHHGGFRGGSPWPHQQWAGIPEIKE